jgi:ribosome-associated protein
MTALADPAMPREQPAPIAVELPITLGQFLKLTGLAPTGAEAKRMVATGDAQVNGQVETRRGRKLTAGDVIEVRGSAAMVIAYPGGGGPEEHRPGGPGAAGSEQAFSSRG